jgi:hypothetical protein
LEIIGSLLVPLLHLDLRSGVGDGCLNGGGFLVAHFLR